MKTAEEMAIEIVSNLPCKFEDYDDLEQVASIIEGVINEQIKASQAEISSLKQQLEDAEQRGVDKMRVACKAIIRKEFKRYEPNMPMELRIKKRIITAINNTNPV